LTDPAKHTCHAYSLTGGKAVNYQQLAEIISEAIGEQVEYISLTADEARQRMENKGMPQWLIHTFLAYAEDQRKGNADFVSDDVPEILGKSARTVEAFVKDHVELFK
jgi:NAD(P)H dehydrogenase (quinone)